MKNTIILLISIATFIACAKQKAEQVSTIDSTLQVSVDSILQNKWASYCNESADGRN